jgi:hypothetical protein
MPPGAQLPPDIRELPDHHAFVRRDENPWAVMDDIMTNLQRPSLLAQWRRRRGLK